VGAGEGKAGAARGRVVILDRDGVINRDSEAYVKSPEEWHPLPGSLEAVAALNRAGYRVVVATNQSGLGRGLFTEETLGRIHERMTAALEEAGAKLSGIYYCPHRPDEGCVCRKPAPGLLHAIARDLDVVLEGVAMVGDKLTDVLAAEAVGARPILVRPAGERLPERPDLEAYPDLASAVRAILGAEDCP
jgi:D-glycero-D-manno-heptose 1,7-bisphosphate phosphatase